MLFRDTKRSVNPQADFRTVSVNICDEDNVVNDDNRDDDMLLGITGMLKMNSSPETNKKTHLKMYAV